jgi:hypothetical protein
LIEALVKHRYTTHVRELDTLLIRSSIEGEGRYIEPPADLRRSLAAAPAPAAAPVPVAVPPVEIDGMSPVERQRLALLRQHRFSPTECGRDPAYRGNRQAADLHLRQLVCRALQLSDWDVLRAGALLAGSDEAGLHDKAVERIRTFLSNLRARLAADPEQRLPIDLAVGWKGNVEALQLLVDALRAGKISG